MEPPPLGALRLASCGPCGAPERGMPLSEAALAKSAKPAKAKAKAKSTKAAPKTKAAK